MELKEFQEATNQYTNAENRGELKKFLMEPHIDSTKKTIVFSTPLISGGFLE